MTDNRKTPPQMMYFAMIDGERRGPFSLERLAEEGVRPGTYVWCKGMEDWEKAEDVADICRWYRRRLFDAMHPSLPVSDSVPVASGAPLPPMADDADTSRPPLSPLFPAVFATLFCFPLTGAVAVYFSYKARVAWMESMRSESKGSKPLYSDDERNRLRLQAHDYSRRAKMWLGITLFMGLIMYAFVGFKA